MKNDKKGFLFVLSIFLILTYILMSIGVWVKGLESSERSYAEIYKESNVELAVGQLTPQKVSQISDQILQSAFFKLGMYSVDNPVKSDLVNEFYYVNKSIYEYLMTGAPAAENFDSGTAPAESNKSSLTGWVQGLNESLSGVGVYITEYRVWDFNTEQTAIDTVNYTFKLKLSMADTAGVTSLTRQYNINGVVNITGFYDQAILRGSTKMGATPVYRRFFFNDAYQSPSDISPNQTADNVQAGQGWFYGYVVTKSQAADIADEEKPFYILLGTYDNIITTANYTAFGAYIVTSSPTPGAPCAPKSGGKVYGEANTFNAIEYSGVDCTDTSITLDTLTSTPFVVVPGFTTAQTGECKNLLTNDSSNCVLFVARYSPSEVAIDWKRKKDTTDTGVYDIENLRDYTLCGYYTHSEKAPSYLQRFFADAYVRNSTDYGIETFLIGQYVSISKNSMDLTQFSALDRDMFTKLRYTQPQQLIRGTPGCKSQLACSNNPETGLFGLGDNATIDYNVQPISCETGARCDQ
ncbi:MAG: hypothetical protein V1492_03640 [Candidatus Micrarchaeota archaeon]